MESIYGEYLPQMEDVQRKMLDAIEQCRQQICAKSSMDPIDHVLSRIKSEESMREKCRRRGLPETTHSALVEIQDAIGIRVVCPFVNDVYRVSDYLKNLDRCEVVNEKDYIRKAKPNGYRSLHLILRYESRFYVEIQLRTISMDVWAALEHQLRYKHDIGGDRELIEAELKRCADELASTDLSMQTIRDMIESSRQDADDNDEKKGQQE